MPKRSIYWILFLGSHLAIAQELPPIQNFTPKDYKAANQNWSISQSADKLIYVANNVGLLAFNGARWTLYPSPNETIMRSVEVVGDKVYTGCYMEFGYWQQNTLGVLEYTSLSKKLGIELIEDEEIWNIFGIDEWVVFQSLNRIYIVDEAYTGVNIIDAEEDIVKMFRVGGTILFQKANKGIFKIENGEDFIFLEAPIFKNEEVVNIFRNGKDFLMLTRNNGFYRFRDGTVLKEENINGRLSDFSIYSAIQLSDKNFALGTISSGLIYLNRENGLVRGINQSNGLLNNTVLSIFEDADNNIWAGLDNGISYLNIHSPIQVFKDKNGILGSVYASAIHDDYLYLGTNQGLFYKHLTDDMEFKMIEGTNGQVWCLKVINGLLFCGHHTGTFVIDGNQMQDVSNVQGTWNIDRIRGSNDLIVQGNYDGLYVLENFNGRWQLRNKIAGFHNSSRYFEVLGDKVFVNHEYKGVFNLTVDSAFSTVTEVRIDTTLKGANSGITNYKGDILYAYKKGIFKYNEAENEFVRDSVLSTIYDEGEYIAGRIVVGEEGDRFWMFTKNNLTLVASGNLANQPKVKKLPLTFDVRGDVVEHESIININGNQYVLGTSSGYITVDINDLKVKGFKVYISSISSGINKYHSASENLIDKSKNGIFESKENNLGISFHAPEYYKYFKPTYQFQMIGIYDVWSEWTTESIVFYENLPPGNYLFNVRAKVGEKISENVASYSFSIAKPWYIAHFMIVLYGVAIFVFSAFMHHTYRTYYKKKQQTLIDQNKRELGMAILQGEKEIIDLKNEQLQRENRSKSNELAASTMSIVKKNELLTEIKDLLGSVEDKKPLAPVIRLIDKNLNHDENWKLFQEAFNNNDTEFFKNLKNLHNNLSRNDLKLCAYLRLNLNSKEIAQLINISPRSVEMKRYRLRKKLNLDNDENLADYILRI